MFRVERTVGLAATGTGALGGMRGDLAVVVHGEERSLPYLERLVDELLRSFPGDVGCFGRCEFLPALRRLKDANDDLDVVFLETVQSKRLVCAEEFSVGPDLGISVLRGPRGDVGVESLSATNDRREEQ